MRILVTGGAGYIGSVLVGKLLEEGHEVVVLDSFTHGQSSLLGYCYHPKLEIIRGDARDSEVMRKAMEGANFIFPLAAIVGAPACDKDRIAAVSTNLEAIKTLLKLRSKEQGIVFPCTNSGYGLGQGDIYCTEETPLHPISLYGKTKVEAEKAILDAGNSISLRLATAFGVSPFMRTDTLVNNFVYRAVTDGYVVLFEGHFRRNYIHVRDVARAFGHCMDNFDGMKNEPYNIGLSDTNISKLELCQEIKEEIASFYFAEAEVGEDVDKRNYMVSNAKIEATGYRPVHSLRDGIAELIKAYQMVKPLEPQGNVPRR